MPHPLLIVSQSDSLIQIVDINSHTDWQTVQIQRSQLIWIYTVCKGRAYPGSAGQGLSVKLEQYSLSSKALDKGVLQINIFFSYFSMKTCCTQKCLRETLLMSTHNTYFCGEIRRYYLDISLIWNKVLYIIYSIICFSFPFQEAYFQLVVGNETADTTVSELVSVVRTFSCLVQSNLLKNSCIKQPPLLKVLFIWPLKSQKIHICPKPKRTYLQAVFLKGIFQA